MPDDLALDTDADQLARLVEELCALARRAAEIAAAITALTAQHGGDADE